jgi:ethanolamine utilization protein EutQ (cupin superfamily)
MKNKLVYGIFVFCSSLFINTLVFAQKAEERNVGSFKSVKIGGDFDVVVQKGSTESVKITASGIDLQDIITEIEGSTLRIGTRQENGSWNWKNNYDVDIVITYKELASIVSSGSSKITTNSAIKGEFLEITLSGSGKFRGEVQTQKLELTLSGSGDIDISGNVHAQNISISGSGDVEAVDLQSSVAKVKISGSGNAKVAVSDELDARVTGSGDIRFVGNPQKQIFKSTGSGAIKKIN